MNRSWTAALPNSNVVVIAIVMLGLGWMWFNSQVSAETTPDDTLTVPYQGVFRDDSGSLIDGRIPIRFAVYDSEAAVDPLWSGEQDVQVSQGLFQVDLGSVEAFPDNLFDGSVQWLGIKVGNDDEMSPRQQLTVGLGLQTDDIALLLADLRSDIKSDVEAMFEENFPDVELALSICGALDNGIRLGGGLELVADVSGDGHAGADVYGSGGEVEGGAELGVTIIGL